MESILRNEFSLYLRGEGGVAENAGALNLLLHKFTPDDWSKSLDGGQQVDIFIMDLKTVLLMTC